MPPIDPFNSYPRSPTKPAQDAFLITPSDTVDLPFVVTSLWNTASGSIRVTTAAGTILTLPAGMGCWPLSVTKVWATGTTATGLVGLV